MAKVVELGSPLSPNDLARAMSAASGKTVVARAVPRDEWTDAMRAMQFPELAIVPYQEMLEGCNSGWIGFGVAGTDSVPATITPLQFFQQTN